MQDQLSKILDDVRQLQAEFDERRKTVFEQLRTPFETMFLEFLDKHPEIYAVEFTAFTPYFNDGDECIYSVHDPVAVDEEGEEIYPLREDASDDLYDISHIMSSVKDFIRYYYGDHVRVRITCEGTEVDKHDHY